MPAALEAGAPVIHFSRGTPTAAQVAMIRAAGAKMGMQISTAGGARQAMDVGVDYIVCQGQEAGGHIQAQCHWHDNLHAVLRVAGDTPVLVSGGLGDGKALREALMLGASGGVFGTRFVATQESTASQEWKNRLMKSLASDAALSAWDRISLAGQTTHPPRVERTHATRSKSDILPLRHARLA